MDVVRGIHLNTKDTKATKEKRGEGKSFAEAEYNGGMLEASRRVRSWRAVVMMDGGVRTPSPSEESANLPGTK
jgi:hypothetical protein